MDLQEVWNEIIDRYPPGLIELAGSTCIQLLVTFVYGLPYMLYVPKSRKAMRKCLPFVLSNTFYVFLVHATCLYLYARGIGSTDRFLNMSFSHVSKKVPSLQGFIKGYIGGLIIYDIMFYCVHRLLHTKLLMRATHHFHHSFKEEVPWAFFYVHPVEYISVVFGIALGLSSLIKANVLGLFFGIGIFMFISQKIHTGYGLPGLIWHEGHHTHWGKNYGAIGLTDYLTGTLLLEKG